MSRRMRKSYRVKRKVSLVWAISRRNVLNGTLDVTKVASFFWRCVFHPVGPCGLVVRGARGARGRRCHGMTHEAGYGANSVDAAVVDIASTSAVSCEAAGRPLMGWSRQKHKTGEWMALVLLGAAAVVVARTAGLDAGVSSSNSLSIADTVSSVSHEHQATSANQNERRWRADDIRWAGALGQRIGRCAYACPSVDSVSSPFGSRGTSSSEETQPGNNNTTTEQKEVFANLFIAGDSFDKLLHVSHCNLMMPVNERCAFGCSTPTPAQYPANFVNFFEKEAEGSSGSGDPDGFGSSSSSCCGFREDTGTQLCCATEAEFRTAIGCRPRTYHAGAGDAGFVMLLGADPDGPYFSPPVLSVGDDPYAPYLGYGLPIDSRTRIELALGTFLDWTATEGARNGGEVASVKAVAGNDEAERRPRTTTTLLNGNVLWQIFDWGGDVQGFDLGAVLAAGATHPRVTGYADALAELVNVVRGVYEARGDLVSKECIVFRTQPQPFDLPAFGKVQAVAVLVPVLNDAIRTVAKQTRVFLFDAAAASAEWFPTDSPQPGNVAAAAFLQDGYHPTSRHATKLATLFQMWANKELPERCRLWGGEFGD